MGRQKITLQKGLELGSSVFIEWHVEDFEEVKKGQLVATVSNNSSSYPIYSCCDGCCKRISRIAVGYNGAECEYELLGYIYTDTPEDFPNIPTDKLDKRTHTHSIQWKKLGGYKSIGIPLSVFNSDFLYISCDYSEGKAYLGIYFLLSEIKIKKGDTISLKLSNGRILDFTVDARPVSVSENVLFPEDDVKKSYREEMMSQMRLARGLHVSFAYRNDNKHSELRAVRFALSKEDLAALTKENVVLFRLTYNSIDGAYFESIPYNFEMSPAVCPEVIKNMFQVLSQRIATFDNSYSIEDKDSNAQTKTAPKVHFDYWNVCLIRDEKTKWHKIEIYKDCSSNTDVLPGEALIACHKYPSKKLASTVVFVLQNTYMRFQMEGEWFNLPEERVMELKEGLE